MTITAEQLLSFARTMMRPDTTNANISPLCLYAWTWAQEITAKEEGRMADAACYERCRIAIARSMVRAEEGTTKTARCIYCNRPVSADLDHPVPVLDDDAVLAELAKEHVADCE